jgi:hypothetical protein
MIYIYHVIGVQYLLAVKESLIAMVPKVGSAEPKGFVSAS